MTILVLKEEEMEEMLWKCNVKYGPHNCEKRAQLMLYKHYPPVSKTSFRLKCMFKLS